MIKSLRFIITVIFLILFLIFIPACNGTEPVSKEGLEIAEEPVDELYPSKIAISTETEWFFSEIWEYVKNNENQPTKTLEGFLKTNKDHFVERGNWQAIKRELDSPNSFHCVSFNGEEAKKQCKALANFYVYYVLGKESWLGSDDSIIKNSALRLSNNLGETVVNKKREKYNIKALLEKGVRKGDIFFIYVNPQEEWGHYGIIYDVTDDDILVLDANRKFDGKLRISSIEDLMNYVGDSWAWIEVARFGVEEAIEEPVVEEVTGEPEEEAVAGEEKEEVEETIAEGKIAFTSDRDGNMEIYIMNVNGSEQRRLTDSPADDWDPSFSPDGSKIAFVSYRDGNPEIYIMNIDGSGQTRLTNNSVYDWDPSFSPDGSKIAFTSDRDGFWEIYIMNVDGSGQINLTNNTSHDWGHSFSPKDFKIAFMSNRDGYDEIYLMNVDGSGQAKLTNTQAVDCFPCFLSDGSTRLITGGLGPCFSPDGSKIVFCFYWDKNSTEIYTIDADGSRQARLTGGWGPCFSPDGSKIVFCSIRDENWEIYIMSVDGSGQTRLTNNSVYDWDPSFSSDGSKIAFVSYRDGNPEIYIMNIDGSEQINLTNNPADDRAPCFSP